MQKAASKNKTDAQTYVQNITDLADRHMSSSKIVDRDPAMQAMMQLMETTGLSLVLGGKNLGKSFLKGKAINRCKKRKDNRINFVSVNMRDADMVGKPLMAALDLQQKNLSWRSGEGCLGCSTTRKTKKH